MSRLLRSGGASSTVREKKRTFHRFREEMAQGTLDQRQHPRVDLSNTRATCLIDIGDTAHPVCDISRGGICFISDRRLDRGQRLKLNVEFIFGAEIEVVYCEMFMADEMFLEAKYRIGASFVAGALDDEMFALLRDSFKE